MGCSRRLLTAIKLAAKVVNREINMAGLVDILGAAGNQNVQGEDQQKLDVFANRKFIQVRVFLCTVGAWWSLLSVFCEMAEMHCAHRKA